MCGGFKFSKWFLIALNTMYIIVGFLLILIAGFGKTVAHFTSIGIIGGIIACGFFLLVLSFLGILAAAMHNQVLLFFYMTIMFLLFIVQFGVAVACLALSRQQQFQLVKRGWKGSSNETRASTQQYFECCGFEYGNLLAGNQYGHPACNATTPKCCLKSPKAPCCTGVRQNSTETPTEQNSIACPCETCWSVIEPKVGGALKSAGGLGVFFSFTELIGVWMALRYRNQKDPRADPRAFL